MNFYYRLSELALMEGKRAVCSDSVLEFLLGEAVVWLSAELEAASDKLAMDALL